MTLTTFETFDVRAFPVVIQTVTSLRFETILRMLRYLTECLIMIVTERGYSFTTTAEREIVGSIPIPNIIAESSDKESTNRLPDGSIVIVGARRFLFFFWRCSLFFEGVMTPSLLSIGPGY